MEAGPTPGPIRRYGFVGAFAGRLNLAIERRLVAAYGPRLYGPPLPPGLVSLADAPWTLLRNRRAWGVRLGWWEETFIRTAVARRIEEALRTGGIRAGVVLPTTGDLAWAPAGTWRRAYGTSGFGATAIGRAVRAAGDRTVLVAVAGGPPIRCLPFVAEHDLAACFGAYDPPGAPTQAILAGIRSLPECAGLAGAAPAATADRPDPWEQHGAAAIGCPAAGTEGPVHVLEAAGAPISLPGVTGDAGSQSPLPRSSGPGLDTPWTRRLMLQDGLGGAPSCTHLIIPEMERRFAAGTAARSVTDEARALRAWYVGTHPTFKPPGQASLENAIRAEFKRLSKEHGTTH